MFAARGKLVGQPLEEGGELGEYFIRQPSDPLPPVRAESGTASGRSPTRPSATWALAYAVGLILIYLLVVAQFRSYLDAARHHGADPAHR